VEGRQQHPALAQVALFVHREQRARAEHFAERVLAAVQDVGLRRVDLFDQIGAGDQDHLAEAGHGDREGVAVAPLEAADQRVAGGEEEDAVEQAGRLRARREAVGGGVGGRHGGDGTC
jgi:hypothetical protein